MWTGTRFCPNRTDSWLVKVTVEYLEDWKNWWPTVGTKWLSQDISILQVFYSVPGRSNRKCRGWKWNSKQKVQVSQVETSKPIGDSMQWGMFENRRLFRTNLLWCSWNTDWNSELDAGGKPSTWLPPGRLAELLVHRAVHDSRNRLTRRATAL